MPIYEYQCENCNRRFEVMQRMTEPVLSTCEKCGGHVRRLISQTSFVLKGDGWYVTDYPSESRKKAMSQEKSSSESKSTGRANPPVRANPPSELTSTLQLTMTYRHTTVPPLKKFHLQNPKLNGTPLLATNHDLTGRHPSRLDLLSLMSRAYDRDDARMS